MGRSNSAKVGMSLEGRCDASYASLGFLEECLLPLAGSGRILQAQEGCAVMSPGALCQAENQAAMTMCSCTKGMSLHVRGPWIFQTAP